MMLGPKQKQAKRLDGPPWRGGSRWAIAMAGRKNERKTRNNIWASTEHGPRKKKYNLFRKFLIQGNGIEIKSFEYFQTKFELDSK
jgi:hypothetical protein